MTRSIAIISVLACATLSACAQDLSGMGAGLLDQTRMARQAIAAHDNQTALQHIQQARLLADQIISHAPPEESPVVVAVSKEVATTTTYRPVRRGNGPLTARRMKSGTAARDVEQDTTTANLDVTRAAGNLDSAQLSLERNDAASAAAWLTRVSADVTKVNANRNVPLLMARQNLLLARSRVLQGQFKAARAPLRAAAQALGDFQRQSPGPQAQQAGAMREQILNFTHVITHDQADALRLIDEWLSPVDQWSRMPATQ